MKFTRKSVIIICVVALAAVVFAGYMIFADNCRRSCVSVGDSSVVEQPLPQDWPAEVADPRKQTPQKAIEFIKSGEFTQLSAEHKRYYVRSTSGKVMQYRVEKFSSLPAEDRDAFLDEMIDNLEQWQQDRLEADRTSAETIRTHTEPFTPQQREQFTEFRQALRQRMLQRGIEPGRPKY